MKILTAFFSFLFLTACNVEVGNLNFWPERLVWAESFKTLPITFYDTSMRPVKSELLAERNFPENRALSATVGYSVVDDKIYRKIYYAKEVLIPNMNGGLVSGSSSVMYEKGQQVDLIGEVFIDNVRYALIPTEEEGFVALVDGTGNMYTHIGQIRHDRLALLDADFAVYPRKFSFDPKMVSRIEQTTPVKGFDVKYGGLKAGYVTFIYYKFDAPSNDGLHDSGEFEVLSYPNKPGPINIRGIKLRIIEAKKDSIDYMIIQK